MKHILMGIKKDNHRNIVIVGDVNTQLTSVDRTPRQEVNKETVALNNTLDQMDLINIYRAFHPKAAEYMFFSSAHEMLSRID